MSASYKPPFRLEKLEKQNQVSRKKFFATQKKVSAMQRPP
jgi:hypothetical protein